MSNATYVRWFGELSMDDLPLVGGKNASLGEMFQPLQPLGVRIPDGFSVTATAYREALDAAGAGLAREGPNRIDDVTARTDCCKSGFVRSTGCCESTSPGGFRAFLPTRPV